MGLQLNDVSTKSNEWQVFLCEQRPTELNGMKTVSVLLTKQHLLTQLPVKIQHDYRDVQESSLCVTMAHLHIWGITST